MKCPHCGNEDKNMLDDFSWYWFCKICSKVFSVPRKGLSPG